MKSIKILSISLFICITAIIIIIPACKKEEVIITPPKAIFSVNPPQGNTTTSFAFDASATQSSEVDDELLFRWDWDGDGTWDTPFSKSKKQYHRYFNIGSFAPTLEARTYDGLSDTLQMNMDVVQGYSPPRALFSYTPDDGHILTEFLFDASATNDDEDSLSALRFRWDWDGNGIWDTDYLSEAQITHQFLFADNFNVILQVIDPSGLSNVKNHSLAIVLHNPMLFVDFSISPESGTNEDIYTFDASVSKDLENPGNSLFYKWTVENNAGIPIWETDFLDTPITTHQFSHLEVGDLTIDLVVEDINGLTNYITKDFSVEKGNSLPSGYLTNPSPHGNINTEFFFTAHVFDAENYAKDLQVRWDFNSDGTWDTDFSKEKTIYYSYENPGVQEAILEVIDTENYSTISDPLEVIVTSGTNETGLIIDGRRISETMPDPQYYGSVKIGNQWWMSDNLNINSYTGNSIQRLCYRGSYSICEEYGGLYKWSTAMNGSQQVGAKGICPTGWHIPSDTEWETLITFLGSANAGDELKPWGSTDFFLQYSGTADYNGSYRFLGQYGVFWSSTKMVSSTNSKAYTIKANSSTIESSIISQEYGYSIRCIKD
jgi:uncharacterized protein (TIGR02145 family)